LLRVTVWAALVVPSAWFPKERLVEERLAAAAALVTEKPTLQGAKKMASALMAARWAAAFTPADRSTLAGQQDACMRRPPPV